jgi:hypothetical protein
LFTPADRDIYKRQIDATDREIDNLVYELYGLTDEEIKESVTPLRPPLCKGGGFLPPLKIRGGWGSYDKWAGGVMINGLGEL